MERDGRNDGRKDRRLRLHEGAEAGGERRGEQADEPDLVFDFTGLGNPSLWDLSLVLTARLQAGGSDRVWVRALPAGTRRVLRGLGLDHLFRHYPSEDVLN